MKQDPNQTIFGLPVVVTDLVAEGEILCGSFPPPERDEMTFEEYAQQCAKQFVVLKMEPEDQTK